MGRTVCKQFTKTGAMLKNILIPVVSDPRPFGLREENPKIILIQNKVLLVLCSFFFIHEKSADLESPATMYYCA